MIDSGEGDRERFGSLFNRFVVLSVSGEGVLERIFPNDLLVFNESGDGDLERSNPVDEKVFVFAISW